MKNILVLMLFFSTTLYSASNIDEKYRSNLEEFNKRLNRIPNNRRGIHEEKKCIIEIDLEALKEKKLRYRTLPEDTEITDNRATGVITTDSEHRQKLFSDFIPKGVPDRHRMPYRSIFQYGIRLDSDPLNDK